MGRWGDCTSLSGHAPASLRPPTLWRPRRSCASATTGTTRQIWWTTAAAEWRGRGCRRSGRGRRSRTARGRAGGARAAGPRAAPRRWGGTRRAASAWSAARGTPRTRRSSVRSAEPAGSVWVWGWHKASPSDCLPLAAPIGLSPLLILTLCGSERVLVVSREPPDNLSCLTIPGFSRPGDGLLPRCGGRGGGGGGGSDGWDCWCLCGEEGGG